MFSDKYLTLITLHLGHENTCCCYLASFSKGNLSGGEILEQLLHAMRVKPFRNVVFMGMGEPLDNTHAVLMAVRTMLCNKVVLIECYLVYVATVLLFYSQTPFLEGLQSQQETRNRLNGWSCTWHEVCDIYIYMYIRVTFRVYWL